MRPHSEGKKKTRCILYDLHCRGANIGEGYAAGVDLYTLSRRMGHSSITVTADRYGHLYQGNSQDADALDRLLKKA